MLFQVLELARKYIEVTNYLAYQRAPNASGSEAAIL
jgi:hypothetical protein